MIFLKLSKYKDMDGMMNSCISDYFASGLSNIGTLLFCIIEVVVIISSY